jgi:ankyrin repeat protein
MGISVMRHATMDAVWESAAKSGDAAALKSKLAEGLSVDARDRFGQTALMLAAKHGQDSCCEVLIAAGANLDVTAKYGLSALMLAVVNHHEAVARLVAASGADLSLRGSGAPGFAGKSAADLARAAGFSSLAEELSS